MCLLLFSRRGPKFVRDQLTWAVSVVEFSAGASGTTAVSLTPVVPLGAAVVIFSGSTILDSLGIACEVWQFNSIVHVNCNESFCRVSILAV